ncbi:hypothetical protein AB0G05_22695 [Nonomuraea wenchangensis]
MDDVVRLALEAISLDAQEALAAAGRRREEVLTSEESVYRPDASPPQAELPEDDGIRELVEIEEMLAALRPLSGHIADAGLRDRIGAWYALEDRFALGEAASEAALRRRRKTGDT